MSATATPQQWAESLPCPGPIPTSLEHAERCRACGKCGTIVWPLAAAAGEGGWTADAGGRIN
jgi:hypothetical protein